MENEKQEREYLINLLRSNKDDLGRQELTDTVTAIIQWHETKVKNVSSNSCVSGSFTAENQIAIDYNNVMNAAFPKITIK